jgi:hypothetical protein
MCVGVSCTYAFTGKKSWVLRVTRRMRRVVVVCAIFFGINLMLLENVRYVILIIRVITTFRDRWREDGRSEETLPNSARVLKWSEKL